MCFLFQINDVWSGAIASIIFAIRCETTDTKQIVTTHTVTKLNRHKKSDRTLIRNASSSKHIRSDEIWTKNLFEKGRKKKKKYHQQNNSNKHNITLHCTVWSIGENSKNGVILFTLYAHFRGFVVDFTLYNSRFTSELSVTLNELCVCVCVACLFSRLTLSS